MRNFREPKNSSSEIVPSAHHPAVLLIHSGICPSDTFPEEEAFEIVIMLFSNKNSIPATKVESFIASAVHHPALLRIHIGETWA